MGSVESTSQLPATPRVARSSYRNCLYVVRLPAPIHSDRFIPTGEGTPTTPRIVGGPRLVLSQFSEAWNDTWLWSSGQSPNQEAICQLSLTSMWSNSPPPRSGVMKGETRAPVFAWRRNLFKGVN